MRPLPNDPHLTPDPINSLDRIWAATRPDDPSPAMMDALWACASRELDRIEASRRPAPNRTMSLALPGRRGRFIAWAALAQAAAILIVAGVLFTRRGHDPVPPPAIVAAPVRSAVTPPPVVPAPQLAATPGSILDVPVGQTLLKSMDRQGYTFLDNPPVGHSIPDWTERDVFNELESRAALESRVAL